MPLSPLVSSLISSIIASVLDAPAEPTQQQPGTPFAPNAITRVFPNAAVPGTMHGVPHLGKVTISGKTLPVAPGLQIRDQSNRIVQTSMLSGANFPVLYQMDASGASVWRIWILTPQEISAMGRSSFVEPRTLPMPLY